MRHWWQGEEWAKQKPMEFGKGPDGTERTRRIAVTTKLVEGKGDVLQEQPVHPHYAVRVYVGSIARC